MSVVRFVYFAPHALRAASTSSQLNDLIAEDTESLASNVQSFVDAGLDVDTHTDVFVLPLTDDGAGTYDLARRRYRLHEIVADIDLAYDSDISPLVRPTDPATLRTSPVLRGVVAGDWIGIAATQSGFLANFAPGTQIVVDAPVLGRREVVVEELDGVRLRVSGWTSGSDDNDGPDDGADVFVVGVAVSDPPHVRMVHAFHDWRGNALAYVGDGDEPVDSRVGVPTTALGEAVSDGSAAVSGTDATGSVHVVVRTPGSDARGSVVVAVQFTSPLASASTITLCPANANAAAIVPTAYADSTTTGFTIRLASPEGALAPATAYAWNFGSKSVQAPVDRRPVSLADFNEGLYRLLYSPTDRSMAGKSIEAVFDDYLAHPERIACERDMAKLTQRTFDVTVARTAMSIARGAVLSFQAPYGGAVAGVAGADDIDAGVVVGSSDADRLVPTLAAVMRLMRL